MGNTLNIYNFKNGIQYVLEFAVRPDGLYFITASAPEAPQLLVKTDHSGNINKIWEFPESTGGVYDLEIDPEENTMYLTSWSSGVVYRGKLGPG